MTAACLSAHGQTWTGNGTDSNWSTPSNWTGGVPSSSNSTVITMTGSVRLANTQDITTLFTLNSLSFANPAGAFSLGGGLLEFKSSPSSVGPTLSQNSSSSQTIANNIRVPNTLILAGPGSGRLTLSGKIEGPGGLTQSGPGSIYLTGASAYTGATLVSSGSVTLDTGGSMKASPIIVNGSGTFNLSGGTINDANPTYVTMGQTTGASTSTFNLANGTLTSTDTTVGDLGSSVFNQTGGTHTASGKLDVGLNNGSNGTYNLNGPGQLTVQSTLTVGSLGGSTGTVNLSAGTITASSSVIGNSGTGTLNLSGTGAWTTQNDLTVGSTGSGTINMTGGTFSSHNVYLADHGTASFNQSAGTATINYLAVGYNSTATVTLSGGTLNLTTLAMTNDFAGTSVMNQTGGTLNDVSVNMGSGSYGGSSTYNQTGGTHSVSATLKIGGGAVVTSYNLSAGSLSSNQLYISGNEGCANFNQTGGINTAVSEVLLGNSNGKTGTYNLKGGTLVTSRVASFPGSGVFNFDGGTLKASASTSNLMVDLSSTKIQAGGAIIDTNGFNITLNQSLLHDTVSTLDGGLTKKGNGTLTLTGANTFTGEVLISAGTLNVNSSSALGLGTGAVTLENSGKLVANTDFITGRTFYLNNGFSSLTATTGKSITYTNGAAVYGGSLLGAGTHVLQNGSSLNGTNLAVGSKVSQSGTVGFDLVSVSGAVTQASGATLNYANGMVTGAGTLVANGRINTSAVEMDGVLTVNNGGSVVNTDTNLVLGGGSRTTINSGGSLSTSGATIELNGGLLTNNGSQAGSLNVNYGGTAKGSGTFGSVSVTTGGTFSPGNSPGNPTVADLTLDGGSSYRFDVMDATGALGVGYDSINVTGTLTLNGSTTPGDKLILALYTILADDSSGLAVNFDPSQSLQFTLVHTGGGITGFNANAFTINTGNFLNSLNGGTFSVSQQGNDLMLNYTPAVVPEPSTWLMLLGGLGLLILSVRQRTKSMSST